MSRLLDVVYLAAAATAGPLYLGSRLVSRRSLASPWRRLGFVEGLDDVQVWIHGVSVGEVLAARGLVAALAERSPGVRPVVTSTTATGLRVAREVYPGLPVRECPYDLGTAVSRFLDRIRPRLLVLLELELWPNLLELCRHRAIPVMVANGRISERSARGYRRLLHIFPRFLDGVACFLVQAPVHAERLAALGVPKERIHVSGNLKFDNVTCDDRRPRRAALRAHHGFSAGAPVLVAGSTHAGEEEALLEAAARLRPHVPGLRLVLAPRHPERAPAVAALVRRRGLSVGLRSRPLDPPDPQVLVVDTLGELQDLYALGDVAFVGGTLVPAGGHNLLEPAGMGLPLVVGPHRDTVLDTASELEAAGVLAVARDPAELASVARPLLSASAPRAEVAGRARAVIARHRGAVERTISMMLRLLDGRAAAATSSLES